MTEGVLDRVRKRCREVAEEAIHVRIEESRISAYAAAIAAARLTLPQMDPSSHFLGREEGTVAFFLTLDAINFGSGYFPELSKRPGRSGYYTIAVSLNDYFQAYGPLDPRELVALTAIDCARIFGQDVAKPAAGELMGLFARALNGLGEELLRRFDGSFLRLVEAAGGSAERLVALLAGMPLFNDGALHLGGWVPFLKRAQLAAADLFIAFDGRGPGRFEDIDRLTICADNLVPHVLRHDGLLRYDEALAGRIARGEPISAGSPEEVEMRACAVQVGELLVAVLRPRIPRINAMLLDNFLWHRGHRPEYRKEPRHRTRTVFY